jgi:hypothetical protein
MIARLRSCLDLEHLERFGRTPIAIQLHRPGLSRAAGRETTFDGSLQCLDETTQ